MTKISITLTDKEIENLSKIIRKDLQMQADRAEAQRQAKQAG